ncbi:hypothetical protein [Sphingomonas soli]|uniref:hypothetical protein n=1 Tax=Sphingomonas soli TaxID=266127 RepID=UPI00082A09AB|nr:hypothetical protein [Sphingomonas soli]
MIMRNPFGRWRRPLAALAALMATLALGLAGPALPGVVPLFGWGGLGLLLAGCAGMLSWHGARMRSTPAGRAGDPGAALPASILALAVPGLGAAALLVPVALSIRCASRDSDLRLPALAVLSGLLAMLCTVGSPLLGALACAAIPLLAGLSTRGAALVPANDNPSMERPGEIWALLPRATYANHKNEDTESGTWGVA